MQSAGVGLVWYRIILQMEPWFYLLCPPVAIVCELENQQGEVA